MFALAPESLLKPKPEKTKQANNAAGSAEVRRNEGGKSDASVVTIVIILPVFSA